MKLIPQILSLSLTLAATSAWALDPWQEVKTFADIDDISPEAVKQQLVLKAPVPVRSSPYGISVETLFVIPKDVEGTVTLLRSPDTGGGEGSENFDKAVHRRFGTPAQPADFAKLRLDPTKSSDKRLLGALSNVATGQELYLSKQEAATLARTASAPSPAWDEALRVLLLERASSFQSGSLDKAGPYDNQKEPLRLVSAIRSMFVSRPGVFERFANLLGAAFHAGAAGLKNHAPDYYWEQTSVQGETVFTLGTILSEKSPTSTRVMEIQYYVTSKYFTSIILYEVWPISTTSSLVWRGDYVLTPNITFLKGIEKMAAERIMLIEINNSVRETLSKIR